MQIGSDEIIYFKVMAMEPSDDPILRVNRTKTALVLGGSVPSAVPPDMLISRSKGSVPLQGYTVENLASILMYATSMSIRTLIKVQSFCPVACMACLVCFLCGL